MKNGQWNKINLNILIELIQYLSYNDTVYVKATYKYM